MILKNIMYIIIGLYFIISPLIFKIVLTKLPKDLSDLYLILIITSLLINIYLIYKTIKSMNYNVQSETSLINIFIRNYISDPIQTFYINSMVYVDDYIKHNLLGPKYIGENLLWLTKNLNKHLTEKKAKRIFFVLDILPRFIVIICLFIDVILNEQLKYIYLFGIFTLIPLIFRYIIYTFKGFAVANIKMSCEYLSFCDETYKELSFEVILENFITNTYSNNTTICYIKNITLKNFTNENENFDETLNYYLDQLNVFSTLYNNIDFMEQLKKQRNYKLFLLLTYSYYVILWVVILIIWFAYL